MLSIKENTSNELTINKSKFITFIYRIDKEEDIDKYLNSLKEEYKDATHYCYAYILDTVKRFSDDGEPNGTAGKPILDVLEKNKLNHILCVVIRYFGGIKLGAGGLVRAYSKSVSSCILKTNVIELVKGKRIEIIFDYDKQKEIDYLLKDYLIISKDFNEKIKYIVDVSNEFLDKNKLNNIIALNDTYITISII